ncbi:MAG TPA: hypothetical protein ENI23_03855 [bacterium]|nr:hypothetical protein [bacterium]
MDSLTVIRLFKALEIKTKRKKKVSKAILETSLRQGFVFSPEVIYNYSETELSDLIDVGLGLSPEQMNRSFHKSWGKVKDASILQLIMEQLIHYFTTYGFERMGIYDENSVYIPNEKLEIPKVDIDGIAITVIKGYTKNELKEKILDLLKSGIALHEDTMKDVIEVCFHVGIDQENINDIKNKEVKVVLCDNLKIFPEDPVEFLRYLIYKSIGKTLLIKDPATIEGIKQSDLSEVNSLFKKYKSKYGLQRLAEIFYRFKPIFLSFKTTNTRSTINKIRKLANKYHKPMKEDYLNSITGLIKNNVILNISALERHLKRVNTFRKIRLAYALKYRTKDADSILYKIRNGKAFATDFRFEDKRTAVKVLSKVLDSIVTDLKKNVDKKKIYIPEYVKYALPTTEKQFTGFFPSGTCISIPKDMVFGIYWNNVNRHRIDLDLSLIDMGGGKFGWDSSYRSEDRAILFSGDMTDAQGEDGATELFYVRRQLKQEYIMLVNYYNFVEEVEVPFSIIVAKEQVGNLDKNYMINPNNVKSVAKSKIKEKQKILGLLVTTKDECRFYFSEIYIGMSITSSGKDYIEHGRKYMTQFYQNTISLNSLLEKAGADIMDDRNECDIDLSPESLEKDTIINLLKE